MSKLKIGPASGMNARMDQDLPRFRRRVEAVPPGVCPLALQLSLLQTSEAQTCGKCVPCAEGLPKLTRLLQKVVRCEADRTDLDEMRNLAEMIRDTADCAIGYEAAQAVLEGMRTYAEEYESHLAERTCRQEIGETVPCETLCPAHVNIPAYVALVGEGDYAGAINMIRRDNPFPTACGLVCEHPCEKRCRRTLIDAPINIRGIKKFAVDQIPADQVKVPERLPDSGRKVAVIGAGPSGLTCAWFLALMGHRVVVFEEKKQPGGMLRYGIPAYRFPRERLEEDIRAILSVGNIEIRCETVVDAARMTELRREYDAVYVAIGAHIGKPLDIENIDAEGVLSAVELLKGIGDGQYPDFTGKKVAVIGGGNVAMDCARTAVRAGAEEVTAVYRRRRKDMTALVSEVESSVAEGVELATLQAPAAIETDENGHCTAVITQPQRIGPVKNGRPAPVKADKPRERIPADVVILAIGEDVDSEAFADSGMKADRHGWFLTNEYLEAEGLPGVFAGGDCQTGPKTVIMAIAAGRVAARNIDEYLGYHHKVNCDARVPDPKPNDRTPMGRVDITERPARERRRDFLGVENGMSREEVIQECGRCLRCDHYGCGLMTGGRETYD